MQKSFLKIFNKYYWLIFIILVLLLFTCPVAIVFLIGAVFFISSIWTIFFLQKMKKQGFESSGMVMYYESDKKGNKTPFIQFNTATGQQILDKPTIYSSISINIIGSLNDIEEKNVLILYDQRNPSKFVIATDLGYNIGAAIFFFISGMAIIGAGFFILLGYIKF